ncbi:MAG: replication-associated recombination protein A [Negativicutes bacterium]|nr:replication-associated recombination protein A [Negativicutes bacterium]
MDLFEAAAREELSAAEPLAVRMRPRYLDEFVGQEAVLGKGRFLRQMIERDNIPSIILYGPPGSGKTTLAQIIANSTKMHFERLNAVTSGVSDIRKMTEAARERLLLHRRRTVLFIDEIHRFNKAQQDALLPFVENGTVVLIGATTENPYFEVNAPLLSRVRVIRLQPLTQEALVTILKNALVDTKRGVGNLGITHSEEALQHICDLSTGDARTALNILEQAAFSAAANPDKVLSAAVVAAVAGEKIQKYDKKGDSHYDVVSAFIKSMRGSDPDAALHYLARMMEAGEDVKFIARRIVICAAEDVGLADPQALILAMSAANAVQFVGWPEARILLAQAAIYVAVAPKSNSAYLGIDRAIQDVRNRDCGEVPAHLKDAGYAGAKWLGHGKGYRYPHDYPASYVEQQYLPDKIIGTTYYEAKEIGYERILAERLRSLNKVNKGRKNPEY